jgi:hypothetical protein
MNNPTNPMARISALEAQITRLTESVDRLLTAPTPVVAKRDQRATHRRQQLAMPLSDRNRELALFAWACLVGDAEVAPGTYNQKDWCEVITKLDADGFFPSHCRHLGATLRATLAESIGMKIRWAATPLLGQNEPESRSKGRSEGSRQ